GQGKEGQVTPGIGPGQTVDPSGQATRRRNYRRSPGGGPTAIWFGWFLAQPGLRERGPCPVREVPCNPGAPPWFGERRSSQNLQQLGRLFERYRSIGPGDRAAEGDAAEIGGPIGSIE